MKWFNRKKKEKEIAWVRYQHIPILITNARLQRELLGKRLQWTIKEDGECVMIWQRKRKHIKRLTEVVISSHNQEIAADDIQTKVKACPEYLKILELIKANPTFRVIAEECRKGRSVTSVKTYDRDILYVVDIFDTSIMNYLHHTVVHQHCYHFGLPVVKLYQETRHRTLKDLLKFANHVLEYCESQKEYGKDEGVVVKTFRERHRCKDCGKEW